MCLVKIAERRTIHWSGKYSVSFWFSCFELLLSLHISIFCWPSQLASKSSISQMYIQGDEWLQCLGWQQSEPVCTSYSNLTSGEAYMLGNASHTCGSQPCINHYDFVWTTAVKLLSYILPNFLSIGNTLIPHKQLRLGCSRSQQLTWTQECRDHYKSEGKWRNRVHTL